MRAEASREARAKSGSRHSTSNGKAGKRTGQKMSCSSGVSNEHVVCTPDFWIPLGFVIAVLPSLPLGPALNPLVLAV